VERPRARRGVEEGALGVGRVVGVDGVEPPQAEPLLERLSGELEPRAVEEGAPAVGLGHPEHHRRRVGHVAEARLALAHRGLGAAAGAHVEHQGDHAFGGPVIDRVTHAFARPAAGPDARAVERRVDQIDQMVLGHAVAVVVPRRRHGRAHHRLAGPAHAVQEGEEVGPAGAARELG
jgi:hypothetical protein